MAMATLFVSVLLVFVQTFATAQDFSATCGTQSFPATCSEGAPQDFDKTCRNGIFEADHVFPEERKILLDTYDYESLPDYWTLTSFDNDANQWRFLRGICSSNLFACTFSTPNQDNWVFSQYICMQDAKELFIDVGLRFSSCIRNPSCDRSYVEAYRYDVNGVVSASEVTDVSNYKDLNGTKEDSQWRIPEGVNANGLYSATLNMLRPDPEMSGFYLGLRDPGTCGQVSRIIIYYNVCLAKQVDLVVYPEFAVPPRNGPNEEFLAQCVCNAHNVTSLTVTSFSESGICEDNAPTGAKCECDAGYEWESSDAGAACKACSAGYYRALGITDTCVACPKNTETDAIAAPSCKCIPGFFRGLGENAEYDCTAPPDAVKDLKVLTSGSKSISLEWTPPPPTGRTDEEYRVCYATNFNFDNQDCDPVIPMASGVSNFQYTIRGDLLSFTCYFIKVTTHSGVSELDDDVAENIIDGCTTEGVPNEPFLKRLCTVMIWREPTQPSGDIREYELCFGKCGMMDMSTCFNISSSGDNFLLTSDSERENNVDVQIRARNSGFTGPFSACESIGCEDFQKCSDPPTAVSTTSTTQPTTSTTQSTTPTTQSTTPTTQSTTPTTQSTTPTTQSTTPTTQSTTPATQSTTPTTQPTTPTTQSNGCNSPPITLSLGINGTVYPNNSVFNVTAIGISDSEALIFKTSFSTCCREQRLGQCYYPDGTEVGIRSDYSEIFRNRGVQFIRLNRRVTDIRSGTVPFTPGVYQCCLPNACGDTTCLSFELLDTPTTIPTAPTTPSACNTPPITLSLGINGTVYPNNSVFNVTAIGIGDSEALIFKTPYSPCCKQQVLGQCYYPDGTQVGIRSHFSEIFRNRGVQFIRLNHRTTGVLPNTVPFTPGMYQCCLPNACGDITCISFVLLDG